MDREVIESEATLFDVRDGVQAKIHASGLPIPPRPEYLDGDVNIHTEWERLKEQYGSLEEIPYHLLGSYLDKWTSVLIYTLWVEGVADMDQASAREARDTVKEQLYTLQEGGREIRAASVRTEEIYRDKEIDYSNKLAFSIAVKGLREGYERRVDAISREITRRISDFEGTRLKTNRGEG